MKKIFILTLSFLLVATFNSYSMEDQFIGKYIDRDITFSYIFNGDYRANLMPIKSNEESKVNRLQELHGKIENLANELKRVLANLIADNANIVLTFPKKGPSAKLSTKIMMEEIPNSSRLMTRKKYDLDIVIKEEFSVDEQLQYSKFKTNFESLAISGCDNLIDFLSEYQDILAFKPNLPPIAVEIDLYMYKSEN